MNRRQYRKITPLLLVCIFIQVCLAMPFLSQVWVLNAWHQGVEPSLAASLYEYQTITDDNLKQFQWFGEGLMKLFSYIEIHPSKCLYIAIYYRNQRSSMDIRDNIKHLIMSHFHGSRYKDINPHSISF